MELIHFLITGSWDVNNIKELETIIRSNSISFTIGSSIFLLILVVIAWLAKKPSELVKVLLFSFMILVITVNTAYLAGATIYKNQRSITKGPVHWHADFEIWNCGEKVNLVDPKGWSNKIGSPVYHEHNDERLHVEGVVLDNHHVSLSEFFNLIGGKLSRSTLELPVNEGKITRHHIEECNGTPGLVQVFVYQTRGDTFTQKKIQNFEEYVVSPYSGVPEGDCIIVEFDNPKDKTDKMCQSYKVAKQLGKIKEQ